MRYIDSNKIKTKLSYILLITIVSVVTTTFLYLKSIIKDYAHENAVEQARMMSNQLLATREYLATVAPKINITNHTLDQFAIAPAYVGAKIGTIMNEKHGFYIKQTSLQYRQEANKPNTLERKILKDYKKKKIKGEYYHVEELDNGAKIMHYFKPMYIQKSCLKCHGEPYKDVPEELYNKLVSKYGNRSFNYKVDDFRGAISVTVDLSKTQKTIVELNYNFMTTAIILILLLIFFIFIEKKLIFNPHLKELEMAQDNIAIYKKHLSIVVESSSNAIIAIDKSATITTYNKKAQEIFGFTKEEMIGTKRLLEIIPDHFKVLHKNASSNYLKTGQSKGILGNIHQLEGLRKDGTIFPINISFGANEDQNNRMVVANITDITEAKKQEKVLQQQMKLAQMGEMLSMIAHQWRQPLSSISATITTIEMAQELEKYDMTDSAQVKEYLEFTNTKYDKIKSYIEYLSETINDFRTFFSPHKTKNKNLITHTIDKALDIIRDSLKKQNIELELNYEGDLELELHHHEIMQVVLNIIKNAQDNFIEKNTKEPKLNISTKLKDSNIIISFCDNGGGIPQNIINKIFDTYFSTKSEKNGTGLGLYMSKVIIEEHSNGLLQVKNIDNGVCFMITLNGGG